MEHKWYILNVMAGQEQKIADKIKSMISGDLKKYVNNVLVPCKQIIKIKKGKKTQETQKLFPGYVFVEANLDSDARNIIGAIPKVMGFLGGKNSPQQVSKEKMDNIFSLVEEDVSDSKDQIFEIGEELNVIDGPFEDFSGVVEEFDAEKQRVRIAILIFGRTTSVELNVNQVEKKNS